MYLLLSNDSINKAQSLQRPSHASLHLFQLKVCALPGLQLLHYLGLVKQKRLKKRTSGFMYYLLYKAYFKVHVTVHRASPIIFDPVINVL